MKLRQRSRIALASSLTIHLVFLIALSVLGAFTILDKKEKPVEILFFDSVNPGGSSGGGAPAQAKAEQAIVNTPPVDTQSISDSSAKQQEYAAPTQSSSQVGSATATGNGSGVSTGSGTGAGSGSGNGEGTGDGTGSGSGISNNPAVPPRVTRYIAPDYPSAARSAGISGIVRLQVLINSSGDVQNVEVYESSGNQALDSAGIRAVRSWQFTAAKDNAGRRVACYTIIPIRFNLKN